MPKRANALAVMAKAPISGSVKTRLVPPLTHERAAELAGAMLLDQLEYLAGLQDVDLYVAFTPPAYGPLIESMAPLPYRCFPQEGGDLGERMKKALAELWRRGHRNAALIGSDVAAVPLEFLQRAFEQLSSEHQRVVLGPSQDGGYYLVGMNGPAPGIFSEMTWSHDGVLSETTAKLGRLGIDFDLLPTWFDIDTAGDLELLQASDPSVHLAMGRTVKLLRDLNLWRQ